MAKSHVIQYYLEVENQYLEMLDNLKDLKEMAADGTISAEDFESASKEIDLLKANYERIAYIMFLLNKPRKKGKKLDETSLSWYNALHTASKEAILDEGNDALCTIKELIKEGKLRNE